MRKVRIKKLPKAQAGHAGNGYSNSVPEQVSNWGGADVSGWDIPDIETQRSLNPVPRDEATIEAEKGEVAYGDINGDNFAETYLIGGQKHSNGGTPLNVPEGTFIFSDFRDMKIKDPALLSFFGKTNAKGKSMKKGGFTPAKLAKQYDINKYRAIFEDPNSDMHDRKTAELMIKEYQMKLGGLALAQESQKNYEQGIPEVAMPYMQKMGIKEEDLIGQPPVPETPQQEAFMRYGGDISIPELNQYQTQGQVQQSMNVPAGYHMMPDGTMMADSEMKYQTKGEVDYSAGNLPDYRGTDLDAAWSGSGGHAQMYQAITDALVDPETGEINTFGKQIAEQTRIALGEKDRYKGKSGGHSKMWDNLYGEGSASKLTDQQLLDAFVRHQQRNLMLNASGIEASIYKDSNGQLKSAAQLTQTINPQTGKNYTTTEATAVRKMANDKGYTSLDKAFKDMGVPLGDAKNKRLEQATFHGFNRMIEHKDEFPELADQIAPWSSGLQRGVGDEPGEGKGKQISPIDAFYTNTTAGHLVGLGAPGDPKEKEKEKDKEIIDNRDLDPEIPPINPAVQGETGPWLQDIVNLYGSAIDKTKIRDLYPWAPDVDRTEVQLPRVDPTRELAALSEQGAQQISGIGSLAGSASTKAARMSGLNNAGNIANVISRYNNQNVDLESKEELTNAQLEEQYKNKRYARDKGLFDDTMKVMANSQLQKLGFDREKRALYNQLKTNQFQTDAVNQLNPQYNVDPTVGGKVYHTGVPKPITPNKAKTYRDAVAYWQTQGMSAKDANAAAKNEMSLASGQPQYAGPDISELMGAYPGTGIAQEGGLVMGSNVFPFMFY